MENITLNLENSLINADEMEQIKCHVMAEHKKLLAGEGVSSNMTGWIRYGSDYDIEEYNRIKMAAKYIINNSEAFVLLGIGGSYLGAKAVIEAVRGDFHNELQNVQVYYAGQNMSGSYLKKLTSVIQNKEVSVIVISKSGTTLETAAAFRVVKNIMDAKYGDESYKRIFAITDEREGALRQQCQKNKYESFVIPSNIGGRYSVVTPVGLLPMAAAGLDTDKFIDGLKSAEQEYCNSDFESNICCQYAAARNILNRRGKDIEILVGYEPANIYIGEWWKQLFGESEGKDGKGIFPSALNFTTDLHSMGQYVQDGKKTVFETTIVTESNKNDIVIPEDKDNFDKLNYLSGKGLNYINKKAFEGTLMAHKDGNVPNIVINIPEINEFYIAKLFYFFMMSCGISGYVLGVDPFTQPGVEAYKRNMFKLLGKI